MMAWPAAVVLVIGDVVAFLLQLRDVLAPAHLDRHRRILDAVGDENLRLALPPNRLDQAAAREDDQMIEGVAVGEPHGQRVAGAVGLAAEGDAIEIDVDDAAGVTEGGADVAHVLIEPGRFLAPRDSGVTTMKPSSSASANNER